MTPSPCCERRLRELIDTDLPGDELDRLARVDALLRAAVRLSDANERRRTAFQLHGGGGSEDAVRPSLRLVATPPTARSSVQGSDEERYELKLGVGELSLIYKSLQAARTLGALPAQDELLSDTIQLVDQALKRAV